MSPLSEVPTVVLLQSLQVRARKDPLKYFEPASAEQEAVLRSTAKGTLAIGGNRSGKTQAGAIETCCRAIGQHPYKQVKRAQRIWCISQELPGSVDKPHTQIEALKRWMPVAALRGGSWSTAYAPGSRVLTLAKGQKIEFKSYDQDLLAFESAAIDWVWFDEEPTRKEIFSSCLLRLVDRRGRWMMTLTPVLSLQGKSGIAEELWENRQGADYAVFQLFTGNNSHLPPEEVAALEKLPDEEKAVRLHGAFARLGGRVLSEFDPGRHLVPDFIPPRDWRHYLVIDPGWKTAAHLFASVDPDGRIWLYSEHYAREEPIPQRMMVLHALWSAFGQPEYDVIMDSAGFNLKRDTAGREAPSDAAEYEQAAEALGARWFRPRMCVKADPMAYRVKRFLYADMLKVCKGLRWWQWEQERWTREKERQGSLAGERPEREAPIKRYDHLMDCTRYLVNELPDPLPVPEPGPVRSADYFVQQHLERVLKRRERKER